MRAGFALIFVVLLSSFWAATSAVAAHAKAHHQTHTIVVKASTAIEPRGLGEQCDQPDNSEVITPACHQQAIYAPILLTVIRRFNAPIYPELVAPMPDRRDNARIQPYYRLILFPFHGFW